MNSPPDQPGSVSLLFDRVKLGDSDAFRQLCNRYLPNLVQSVERRTPAAEGLDTDAIANSVMFSLWRAVVDRGHFHDTHDRHGLLGILATIVQQKVRRYRRNATRLKRDSRLTISSDFDATAETEPGPELLAEIRESIEQWLLLLEPAQRSIVQLKAAGYTNVEIAGEIKRSLRAVERHLHTIRVIWNERLATLAWDLLEEKPEDMADEITE